jgi:hypothetical protein
VFYLPSGAVNFIDNVGGTKIEKCDIFVRIIIRNNDDENPESAENEVSENVENDTENDAESNSEE